MSGKCKDLTSMKFGRLTVIERDTSKKGVYWLCQCECGNTAEQFQEFKEKYKQGFFNIER